MPLPENDVARIRRWIDTRNDELPLRAAGLIRYELDIAPRHVTVFDCRTPWNDPSGRDWTRFPVARLGYTATRRTWAILWRDRNGNFHHYDLVDATSNVDALLEHIDNDPTGIFWG